ncbi:MULTISPECIES: ABC transporter permease [Prauserella salsuginis group]|uniref:Osmoprotectant transport system permease protein n=2 Tax=Prauserella salsuginis group TaxID=2893672 RepID=A0A839XMH6_9PSEU|nr:MULTISPECIES: ABC transporter permease subunit [Prauserella salsuginis group]MBB3663941.1 osmoprotectant transport system permease protein [Prauserella sediminis]MCR3721397.1 osmoprotectant transport system permease protein [Prauserella flava]MCR3732387.1 osmoprotectant transport system permease protein [Prauserella salsuginis]
MSLIDELGTYLGSANTRAQLWAALAEHGYLALLPILFGVVLAVGAGWLGQTWPQVRGTLAVVANLVYTIPSLALFVVIPGVIGTTILDSINVVVALSLYTAALLVRPMLDAIAAVPQAVTASATAMGYRPARRYFGVELPLAVPVLAAGVRVAAVSNISLVSVGALIGVGGLGRLFTDGFQREYYAPIVVGVVLTLLLALVVDLLLVLLRRVLTPWQRPAPTRRADEEVAA